MDRVSSRHPDFFRFFTPRPLGKLSGMRGRASRCVWGISVILVLACGGAGRGLTLSPEPLFDGKNLGQWQAADYLGSGAVRIQDGAIRLERGVEQTGIRWAGRVPTSNYEITLEARRIEGRDFFCGLTFPVGESFCSLIVGGWGGKTVGLSNIDGLDAAENDTTVLLDFEFRKWYPIRLRVTDDCIRVWIEGDRVIDADIRERAISTRPEVELCRPLGIMTWMTTGEVRDIVLWRMGGEPLRLRMADRMPANERRDLRERILADDDLEHVAGMARELLKSGFDAGQGYPQVWIRDLNTFIETAIQVHEPEVLRSQLLRFFAAQGPDGDIPDGLDAAGRAHKNTVETDQETSLIQAVARYVRVTGNRTILAERVDGKTVLERMGLALEFLRRNRWDDQRGLIWGATTADWGDVQPEDNPGVDLSDRSHRAVDVYDNAMLAIALRDYLELAGPDAPDRGRWAALWRSVRNNVRLHLWTGSKFRPHLYLDGSPWPDEFNEQVIYYQGGTAVAIEAGLLEADEAARSFETMIENRIRAGATSIGLTLYPAYPAGFFKNPQMARPYSYQNGGDWTWFGGRIIRQMIRHGYIEAAYEELRPMVRRVIENEGFYEWYTLDGKPRGSGAFRGSAGVLATAIDELRAWAAPDEGRTQVRWTRRDEP